MGRQCTNTGWEDEFIIRVAREAVAILGKPSNFYEMCQFSKFIDMMVATERLRRKQREAPGRVEE